MARAFREVARAVTITLLLLSWQFAAAVPAAFPFASPGLNSWLQSKLIQGFLYATNQLRTLPPLAGRLVDGLQRRRAARGDAEGTARLERLRAWSSYVGLHRGVPALVADIVRHKGLALEIAGDWSRMAASFQPGSGPEAWPELLVRNRSAVLGWVRRSLRKARKAFKGGAVWRLLTDLHTEFSSDPLFVTDLLAELQTSSSGGGGSARRGGVRGSGSTGGSSGSAGGGGWVPEQLTTLVQQVFEAAREAMFPTGGTTAGGDGGETAAPHAGGHPRRRRGSAGRTGGAGAGGDYGDSEL